MLFICFYIKLQQIQRDLKIDSISFQDTLETISTPFMRSLDVRFLLGPKRGSFLVSPCLPLSFPEILLTVFLQNE